MTLVVDASVVAAALLDDGPDGRACEAVLVSDRLIAPQLMPFEVTNVIRRMVARHAVDAVSGALALGDLRRLAVGLVTFESVADRVWELRDNLTVYDAAYVAVAEAIGATLVTLDERIGRAPGLRCKVVVPGD